MRFGPSASNEDTPFSPPASRAQPSWLPGLLADATDEFVSLSPTVALTISSPSLCETIRASLTALGYQPRVAMTPDTLTLGQSGDRDQPIAMIMDKQSLDALPPSHPVADDAAEQHDHFIPPARLYLDNGAGDTTTKPMDNAWVPIAPYPTAQDLRAALANALGKQAPRPLRFLLAGSSNTSAAGSLRILEKQGAECRAINVEAICPAQDIAAFEPEVLVIEDE
ncbi:MAG: hypothetical protein UMU75_06555, partial [Halomonas sp.]|nr:hypothetical protein [Halomonas sp.]